VIDAWSGPPPTPQQFPPNEPNGIRKLLDKIKALEVQIREATSNLLGTAGIRLTQLGMFIDSSLTVGGDLTVTGLTAFSGTTTLGGTVPVSGNMTVPGEFTALDTDGSVLLKSGTQEFGDRGLTVNRDDGTPAIVVKRVFSAGDVRQSLQMYDPSGRAIAGDSIVAQSGFDVPNVPIPWTPSDVTLNTYARSTSSVTFVPLFEHYGYRQNPGLRLKIKAWCSDATTTADIQVWDAIGGSYLAGFFAPVRVINVPLATTTPTVFTSLAMVLPGAMAEDIQLEIHVKRTAGAGSVNVAVVRSIGTGL